MRLENQVRRVTKRIRFWIFLGYSRYIPGIIPRTLDLLFLLSTLFPYFRSQFVVRGIIQGIFMSVILENINFFRCRVHASSCHRCHIPAMAASPPLFPDKSGFIDPYATPSPPATPSYLSSIIPGMSLINRFSRWREQLDLPNPGTVENLQKEVKSTSSQRSLHCLLPPRLTSSCRLATHLTNFIFDGGRADLTKSLSVNPLFQVTHSFALGSQTAPPSYTFSPVFMNQNVHSSRYVLLSVSHALLLVIYARKC
jgi:hypothetical protein